MKKSGSAAASNAGGNSLAITERPKPAPSCVASLFQLFAKRKLFSSSSSKKRELLPPVRAQKKSRGRTLGGGGEKSPVGKTRPLLLETKDFAGYPRGKCEGNAGRCSPPSRHDGDGSEMCTPRIVARLMGLSSMPAVSHERSTQAIDSSDLLGNRRRVETSPQKQQKAGKLLTVRHANDSQFSADARRRHPHKLASPIKSPRSIAGRSKARLIEAAAKVLEPGLQSRNRRLGQRHARREYYPSDNGTPSAAHAVLPDMSDQLPRDMRGVHALRSSARNIGATSLHNSTPTHQWSEENGKRNGQARRQPEGNSKGLLVSSAERPTSWVFQDGDGVQRSTNGITDTKQDIRKLQQRNLGRENVPCSPLRQNNMKQNALPVACGAAVPGYVVQRQQHRVREQHATNAAKDFVSSNRNVNSSTSLRPKRKVMDGFGMSQSRVENKNSSTKGPRANSLHSDSLNTAKLKAATPRAMEKGMIIAKGAGLVSEQPKYGSPNHAGSNSPKQVELYNVLRGSNSATVPLKFRSPMKVVPTLQSDNGIGTGDAILGYPNGGSCPKMRSHRVRQNLPSQRNLVFREGSCSTSRLKTAVSVSISQDMLKDRDDPGGNGSFSMFHKMSITPAVEQFCSESPWQCNFMDRLSHDIEGFSKSVELRNSHEKHKANAKASSSVSSVPRGNDRQSSLSTLQASFAHDQKSPRKAADAEFYTSPINMQSTVTTERNSSCTMPNFSQHGMLPVEWASQDSKLRHPGEVTPAVALLLTNLFPSRPHKRKPSFKTFLQVTFDSVLAILRTSDKNHCNVVKAKVVNPIRSLAFDFVMECLDSVCSHFLDLGYMSFSKFALVCTEERLVGKVKKEIARCGDMAGKTLDDLVGNDVEHSNETGMSYLHEAFQIGAEIEGDLLRELIDEIGSDMSKCL